LFGRDYSIKGHGNRNYVQKVADYITEKSQTIQQHSEVVSTLDLAVLTLLNITDEMFQYKEANERTIRELEEKTDRVLTTIDRTV
jgi:cell division protein ZapA